MKKVLYVEEDLNLASTIKSTLNYFQMNVEYLSNCKKAIQAFDLFQPDIIFLNIAMKDELNSFDFAEIIREKSPVPILFTSSSDEEYYLKKAFGVLNSDYIRKPYGITELNLRINKMLYASGTIHVSGTLYKLGDIRYIPCEQTVQFGDNNIHLSQFENEVLAILCKNMSQFVDRNTIIHRVWHVNDSKLKEPSYYNIITKLRRILEIDPRIKIESKLKSMVRIVVA